VVQAGSASHRSPTRQPRSLRPAAKRAVGTAVADMETVVMEAALTAVADMEAAGTEAGRR